MTEQPTPNDPPAGQNPGHAQLPPASPPTSEPPPTNSGTGTGTTTGSEPTTRFVRSRTDKVLGGVCGGLSQVLNVDAVILRLALVLLTVLGFGIAIVFYLACWLLMPWEPDQPTSEPSSEPSSTPGT